MSLLPEGRGPAEPALAPAWHEPVRDGVQRLALRNPAAELRSYALTRRGREAWAPLALVSRSIGRQVIDQDSRSAHDRDAVPCRP
jgi:hypothetical protein